MFGTAFPAKATIRFFLGEFGYWCLVHLGVHQGVLVGFTVHGWAEGGNSPMATESKIERPLRLYQSDLCFVQNRNLDLEQLSNTFN